ncbi:MAG TPA: universal stress protein [Solirubrobacterales bacterium]
MAATETTTQSTTSEAKALKRLLVGFDGSEGGRDALELARLIGATTGAAVSVATVIPYGPLPIPYAVLDDEDAREAEPLFEEARERLGDLEVETHAFGGGSPAMVMTTRAEREDVDLVVVGSPHRGAIGRAVMGSVAHGLLHGAPCAVVVAPRGYGEERHEVIRTIAVAYDGTPEAKAALAYAEAIARMTGGRIRILTVVSFTTPLPSGMFTYVPSYPPDPEKILTEAVNSVDPALAATSQRLDGDPATTLAEACSEDTDLLVVGSRRYGPVTRTLLGSVSTELVHRAPCPVMVVPRP